MEVSRSKIRLFVGALAMLFAIASTVAIGTTTANASCCFADGSCQDIGAKACAAANGVYFSGVTCSFHPCPPIGACCLPNGSCRIASQNDCANLGGKFLGAGASCDKCAQPSGACCLPDGRCVDTTADKCTAAGGRFAEGYTCALHPCPQRNGSCCLPNGTCVDTNELECARLGGELHVNQSCAFHPCPRSQFCSLTQGAYGSAGGKTCYGGQQLETLALLEALITAGSPLTVGVPGRSLTIPDGSEQCIIDRLPGGGSSAVLPAENQSMTAPDCATSGIPIQDGRFENSLLAQTITLSLNVRLDPGLCDFVLCDTIVTQASDDGADSCAGSGDDQPVPGTAESFVVPSSVLEELGADATVCDLLDLANRALGNQLGAADPSLDDINTAVDKINNAFDECRFVVRCGQADQSANAGKSEPSATIDGMSPKAFALSPNTPNPFSRSTAVQFSLPEPSRVRIAVYNVAGQVVSVLADGSFPAGSQTAKWEIDQRQPLTNGIYFYRMEAQGLESNATFVDTKKMVLMSK